MGLLLGRRAEAVPERVAWRSDSILEHKDI